MVGVNFSSYKCICAGINDNGVVGLCLMRISVTDATSQVPGQNLETKFTLRLELGDLQIILYLCFYWMTM
jgi:hypothetical protein